MDHGDSDVGTTESGLSGRRQTGPGLGAALRQAWVGYQRRLDEQMAAAGFDDRRFPDGRVLRICARSAETTASQIGRELGISRQGAAKVVGDLRGRGYVAVVASATSGREKIVSLTPRAADYLAAQRKAARAIERQLRAQIGIEGFESLARLLDALGGDDQPRMSDYLRGVQDAAGPRANDVTR
jgi:DNA-binding MarR family transcriptional regulator